MKSNTTPTRVTPWVGIALICALSLSLGCATQPDRQSNELNASAPSSFETQQGPQYDEQLAGPMESNDLGPFEDWGPANDEIAMEEDNVAEPDWVAPTDGLTEDTPMDPDWVTTAADEEASTSTGTPIVLDPSLPSLTGTDRSHWPSVVVRPDDGTTHHYPYYFRDWLLEATDSTIRWENDIEIQLEAAMDRQDYKALGWHRANAVGFVVQPAKFALDLPLLMVRLVRQPFWKDVTTP